MIYVTRSQWKARYGQGNLTDGAKTLVVVHHDGPYPSRSQPGMSLEQEAAICRTIEEFHANGEPGNPGLTHANPRIAYTAMGMQTGRVFEGCGWGHIGAHTKDHNSSAYGFFVPLCGDKDAPTPELVAAFHEWRQEGVRIGALSPSHIVKGHQDFNKPSCPGALVYKSLVRGSSIAMVTMTDVLRAHPTLRLSKGGVNGSPSDREAVLYVQKVLDMDEQFKTGFYGTVTQSAVKKLQEGNGVEPDGIVGPQTWAIVDAYYAANQ